jgi:hypothetical protein
MTGNTVIDIPQSFDGISQITYQRGKSTCVLRRADIKRLIHQNILGQRKLVLPGC